MGMMYEYWEPVPEKVTINDSFDPNRTPSRVRRRVYIPDPPTPQKQQVDAFIAELERQVRLK